MINVRKKVWFFALVLALALALCGCMRADVENKEEIKVDVVKPKIPEKLETNESGVPILKVYDTEAKAVSEMDLETYVMGVLAGEMKNDWPAEALKAQAILARTFVLKFIGTKDSKYEGADISTDVSEAQAYSEVNINENVRKAVEETKGLVMSYQGEFPQAWFHADAGGKTELPSVALEFKEGDPPYLSVTDSPDSDDAPDDVKQWTVTFSSKEFAAGCKDAGAETGNIETVEVGEKGGSGRAKTLIVNGKTVSAPSLRISLGANEMKSTLIESIDVNGGEVTIKGRGFGHGVGLSQWGAYAMAKDGKNATEIVEHYFKDVDIVKLWE